MHLTNIAESGGSITLDGVEIPCNDVGVEIHAGAIVAIGDRAFRVEYRE